MQFQCRFISLLFPLPIDPERNNPGSRVVHLVTITKPIVYCTTKNNVYHMNSFPPTVSSAASAEQNAPGSLGSGFEVFSDSD